LINYFTLSNKPVRKPAIQNAYAVFAVLLFEARFIFDTHLLVELGHAFYFCIVGRLLEGVDFGRRRSLGVGAGCNKNAEKNDCAKQDAGLWLHDLFKFGANLREGIFNFLN
jgi:hypothetical protein